MNPASWYGHAQLGTALLFSGHSADAAMILGRAVELKPGLTDARINLGQALLDTGRHNEAESVMRGAIEQDKLQPNAWNNLSVALLRRQVYDEAEAAAREALRLQPSHLMAGINLALALSAQNKFSEAIPMARQLVDENPRVPQAWRALAEVLLQAGEKEAGIEALALACRLAPWQQEWQQLLESRVNGTIVPKEEGTVKEELEATLE